MCFSPLGGGAVLRNVHFGCALRVALSWRGHHALVSIFVVCSVHHIHARHVHNLWHQSAKKKDTERITRLRSCNDAILQEKITSLIPTRTTMNPEEDETRNLHRNTARRQSRRLPLETTVSHMYSDAPLGAISLYFLASMEK